MKYYVLTNNIMTNKAGILTTIAAAAAIVTSPANADVNNQVEKQKIEYKQAGGVTKVTCETKLACDALSHSIQAQIDGLNKKIQQEMTKGDNADWNLLGSLQQDLDKLEENKVNISIAVENNKQANQDKVIASKNAELKDENEKQVEENEKQAKYAELLGELRSIEGSLSSLENKGWLNGQTQKTLNFLKQFKWVKYSPDNISNMTEEDLNEIKKQKEKFLNSLKTNPVILHSIVEDLGWVESDKYKTFKNTILAVDPSLEWSFDKIEMDFLWGAAQMKLGTSNLNGVDLESNVLSKTEDGVTTSFSDEEGRFLGVEGSDFKLKSELNSDNEEKLREVNTQVNEILEPINDSLNIVSWILDFIQKAKDTWADFDEAKQQIKSENPNLYSELWLESKNSFDDMLVAINTKKQELEKEKEDIIKKAKFRINQLLEKNTQEAEEKDKVKKEMIKFFDSIGLTKLNQTEFNKVLSQVNLSPWNYGLDWPIDLDNWDIGFNKDFWEASISSQEKLAFVKFFNKMLWEDIVKIDEKNQKIIPLDSSDINSLQKVANKKSGFFMENFNKKTK